MAETDITDLLERYRCPYPLPVVRMRFWGAINSPAFSLSPIEEINDAWEGKKPEFKSPEEAEAFYGAMIDFWNALAQHRALGTFVALTPRSGMESTAGLKDMMFLRLAELNDGFLNGFIGQLTPQQPLEPRVENAMDRLYDTAEKLEMLAEQPVGPNNVNRVRSRFVALDRQVQRAMNTLATLTRMSPGGH